MSWSWRDEHGSLLGTYRVLEGEGSEYIVVEEDVLYKLVPRIADALNAQNAGGAD